LLDKLLLLDTNIYAIDDKNANNGVNGTKIYLSHFALDTVILGPSEVLPLVQGVNRYVLAGALLLAGTMNACCLVSP